MGSLLPRVPTDGLMGRADHNTYNDKYVVLYDAKDVDCDTATKEFQQLLADLEEAGLHTEVRPGYDQTLLVFVKAPYEILGNYVYKSRVKDWLYGIVPHHPGGHKNTIVRGAFEAEDVLSMYHIVNWSKENGGAGITPGLGQWENVKAILPLHNPSVNQALLRHMSKSFWITAEDLDAIRDLFGAKVAFYFAFIQTYLVFLSFPAVTGVMAWLWLPNYSLFYAILTSIWCAVFLEYWKVKEVDLALRWDVKGVHTVKVNRPQFKWEKEIIDEAGRKQRYFPKWKQVVRQLLQIPFLIWCTIALGSVIITVFALEVLISEAYIGPYKAFLEYLPTVLLAVALPYFSSFLEDAATWLTEFENHRIADHHEMSQTQKVFVLNIITNYLPIFLTAFVYIQFGDTVVPLLDLFLDSVLSVFGYTFANKDFKADSDRLTNEVIALVVTGQVSGFFEENILPLIKHQASSWYRDWRQSRDKGDMLMTIVEDDPAEERFLARVRNEATLPNYNVQEDIEEIVLQFGYLALFSPVWPIIPMGFLLNNWVELRSDFAKICIEYQRPTPVRAEGIGPWINSLDALVWLGSISTAAIVHLFSGSSIGNGSWATLPITVFISEHILLLLRNLVRYICEQTGSPRIRADRNQRYANRVKYLDEMEDTRRNGLGLSVEERLRRKSVLITGTELFWTKQVEDGTSAKVGVSLIQRIKQNKETKDFDEKVDPKQD